ncbi:hypothetical protein CALCODRAFT_545011 [Calocera cornea HHB12733]|uniref:Uncharacterized protein n=1 Tax=Calocera cornea HHB12733 TaxID=1353952 RepID=A0A165EZA4_9BASI|nr:hypothetical protein CALCODRAFT_545011 [Calocera cornea HHB12733]
MPSNELDALGAEEAPRGYPLTGTGILGTVGRTILEDRRSVNDGLEGTCAAIPGSWDAVQLQAESPTNTQGSGDDTGASFISLSDSGHAVAQCETRTPLTELLDGPRISEDAAAIFSGSSGAAGQPAFSTPLPDAERVRISQDANIASILVSAGIAESKQHSYVNTGLDERSYSSNPDFVDIQRRLDAERDRLYALLSDTDDPCATIAIQTRLAMATIIRRAVDKQAEDECGDSFLPDYSFNTPQPSSVPLSSSDTQPPSVTPNSANTSHPPSAAPDSTNTSQPPTGATVDLSIYRDAAAYRAFRKARKESNKRYRQERGSRTFRELISGLFRPPHDSYSTVSACG